MKKIPMIIAAGSLASSVLAAYAGCWSGMDDYCMSAVTYTSYLCNGYNSSAIVTVLDRGSVDDKAVAPIPGKPTWDERFGPIACDWFGQYWNACSQDTITVHGTASAFFVDDTLPVGCP